MPKNEIESRLFISTCFLLAAGEDRFYAIDVVIFDWFYGQGDLSYQVCNLHAVWVVARCRRVIEFKMTIPL